MNAAAEEAEEENLQKLVHNLDQMFVAEEVPIVEIPEKRKVQQKISDYFSAV